MTPFISVIIPTFCRHNFLSNSIESALKAFIDNDLEIIIIPNGPDESWRSTAEYYKKNKIISWFYLKNGNACSARNHGLNLANGRYVRFLDDDDYLYPAAAAQLTLMESYNLDLCSAPLQNVSAIGAQGEAIKLPVFDDFPTTALRSMEISGLTQGSVFRRSVIKNLKWRDDVVLYDDYLWMLSIAVQGEVDWLRTSTPVGSYRQHDGTRLSRVRRSTSNSRPLVSAILDLHDRLAATGRLTPERAHAAAVALLTHAHSAFPASPLFLSNVIKQARDISPSATPSQMLFHDFPLLADHLLATEWATIAPRYLTRGYRRLSWFARGLLN